MLQSDTRRALFAAMLHLSLSLFACQASKAPHGDSPDSESSPEGEGSPSETTPSLAETDETTPETDTGCMPAVGAVLFDLGETLVTEQGDLFYTLPEARPMIDALRDLGLPIGIVTNTLPGWDESDLRALLDEPDLLDLFDFVLMSSLADSPAKPDPAIFLEAHALLPGAPSVERTSFVTEEIEDLADQAQDPTEGAMAAGLFGVLLSGAPSALPDATVGSLSEIPSADWLRCAR